MKRRFEETDRFKATTADGSVVYVVEVTTYGMLSLESAGEWVVLNRHYRTAVGSPVQLKDGDLVDVRSGTRLVRG